MMAEVDHQGILGQHTCSSLNSVKCYCTSSNQNLFTFMSSHLELFMNITTLQSENSTQATQLKQRQPLAIISDKHHTALLCLSTLVMSALALESFLEANCQISHGLALFSSILTDYQNSNNNPVLKLLLKKQINMLQKLHSSHVSFLPTYTRFVRIQA